MNRPRLLMAYRGLIERRRHLGRGPGRRGRPERRPVTGAAFLLLAITLAAAFADWLAVHHGNTPARVRVQAAHDGGAHRGGAGPRSRATRPPGRGSWSPWLLSLVGDVFLMLPGDLFVAGLAAFLLAHARLRRRLRGRRLSAPGVLVGLLAVAVAFVMVGTRICGRPARGPGAGRAGDRVHGGDLGHGRVRPRHRPPAGHPRRRPVLRLRRPDRLEPLRAPGHRVPARRSWSPTTWARSCWCYRSSDLDPTERY